MHPFSFPLAKAFHVRFIIFLLPISSYSAITFERTINFALSEILSSITYYSLHVYITRHKKITPER